IRCKPQPCSRVAAMPSAMIIIDSPSEAENTWLQAYPGDKGAFVKKLTLIKVVCLVPEEPEDIESPGARVTNSCEPQCECRELNPGPLGEQLVLLTGKPTRGAPQPSGDYLLLDMVSMNFLSVLLLAELLEKIHAETLTGSKEPLSKCRLDE
ncbi:hypothetical protein STEG23_011611, partial [Scotinomys teguina]